MPPTPDRDPVIAIAHRGDPIGHRENTLPAFAAALAQGADMLELDLRRTRDGAIVVLHDQSLLRLWELDASVGDLDLAEVTRLGEGDVRIPTLRQVLDTVPEVELMVDFTRREVVAGALDQALSAGALDRCLFVTGNVEALRLLRGLSGRARIGLTWTEGADPPLDVLASSARSSGTRCSRSCHRMGSPQCTRRGSRCRRGRSTLPGTWPASWRTASTPS